MEPTFAIILPTYRRPSEALRALASIEAQSYASWRCVIVIDDTESDYHELTDLTDTDQRITILKNEANLGKNASLNRALRHLREEQFAGFVVFLDDDDWLAPECLSDFAAASRRFPETYWFVSNRTHHETKQPYTYNKTTRDTFHYPTDCLLERRFGGDATHCIDFARTSTAEFSHRVKNAEEWLYFALVAVSISNFRYLPTTGTYSAGYTPGGLTDIYHKAKEQKQNARLLAREIWDRKITDQYILLYVGLRLVRSLFP